MLLHCHLLPYAYTLTYKALTNTCLSAIFQTDKRPITNAFSEMFIQTWETNRPDGQLWLDYWQTVPDKLKEHAISDWPRIILLTDVRISAWSYDVICQDYRSIPYKTRYWFQFYVFMFFLPSNFYNAD